MNIEHFSSKGDRITAGSFIRTLLIRALSTKKADRFGQSAIILSLLSACGGGGSGGSNSSGKVIDGYISSARVFRDSNNDFTFNGSETSVLTNSSGSFSGLSGSTSLPLVADSNDGIATDTATGLPFLAKLVAPSDYEVITPVTTMVVALTREGVSANEAEGIVLGALGLSGAIDLSTFDPFSSNSDSAAAYKSVAVKISNILMISDGDVTADNSLGFGDTLNNFSNLLRQKHAQEQTIDLSDLDVISELAPNASEGLISEISNANSLENYEDTLDEQLLLLSDNADGVISTSISSGSQLIAIEIDGVFNSNHNFVARIYNDTTGSFVESAELVSFGSNVAVFRFSNADLNQLGDASLSTVVTNNSTSETFLSDQVIVLGSGSSGGGGGAAAAEPAVTDSGVVADGYISGARVFRDTNQDGAYDAGEIFVLTDSNGEFEGLAGDSTKPIVADGNDGQAVDTSTGITFNSVLSAPAGSKVVNPITTIVNELLIDDPTLAVADANLSVARAMGLTNVVDGAGAQVDFTKFDPISNQIFGDAGTTSISADLATVTQGVATYVANLIVSGANEKGGDVATQAATTKSIISNLKDTVKTKSNAVLGGDNTAVFDFTDTDDILLALGDSFNASSSTLEKLKDEFNGFDTSDPATTAASFDNDALIEKQLLSQSEFGDGVLTDAEAANGAVLVIGPTYDPADPTTKVTTDGVVTVKITNVTTGKILNPFPQVTFSNTKYASVELTSEQLNDELGELGGGTLKVEVKPGALTSSSWDTSTAEIIYQTDATGIYFHKGIQPTVAFDSTTVVVDIVGGVALVTSSDTAGFELSGTVSVDLGASELPTGITLRHLVDGLDTNYDDTGRDVTLEFIDSSGDVVFATSAEVSPTTNATNGTANTGQGSFVWSKSFDATLTSGANISGTFADIPDGNYSIKASFTDAYGANSSTTFTNLTLDRNPPEISSVAAADTSVNISDATVTFTINLSEAISAYDASKISLNIDGTPSTVATLVSAGSLSASLNSSANQLTLTYTPTGEGNVELIVANGAFTDVSGNTYVAPSSGDTNFINFSTFAVDYDLTAPSVSGVTIEEESSAVTTVNAASDSVSLATKIVFSEKVSGLSLDDLTVSTVGGVRAATLSNLQTVASSDANYQKVWYADMALADGLDGSFTVSLASSSYTDLFGNLGPSASTSSITIDSQLPSPFQVALKNEQAEYGQGDDIVIQVVYDEPLASNTTALNASSNKPNISLTIGSNTRSAELSAISESVTSSGVFNVAEFTYTVTNADLSDSDGVGVSNVVAGLSIEGADGNSANVDIGSVSSPLNLSGKIVDGGTSGSAVDGYVEGAVVYADNDDDNAGLTIATVSSTSLQDVTTRTAYTVYSLTSADHGVSADGIFLLSGNDTDGWNAYSISGDGSTAPYALSETVDAGALTVTQAVVDALVSSSVNVDRTETVYALTNAAHGVSSDGNFVLRGSEADGFEAYEVTGSTSPYATSATIDTGTLSITSQIDIYGGSGLTEGDAIAQADSTGGFVIYGADGPLVLEGGFDISTNKEFNVRYKAPDDYTVINPISTLVVAGTAGGATFTASAEAVFDEVFSQYTGASAGVTTTLTASDFKTYNAYDRIAQAADLAIAGGGTTTDVNAVVADALIYQKAAASYALVVDFISNATYHALGASQNNSVADISDNVFAAISNDLSDFTRTFANVSFNSLYDGGDNVATLAAIEAQLKTTLGGLNGVSQLKDDLMQYDVYDLENADLTALSIPNLTTAGAGTYGLEINVDGTGRLVLVSLDTGTDYIEVTGGSAESVDLDASQVTAVSALTASVVGSYTSDEIYELLANSIVAINNATSSAADGGTTEAEIIAASEAGINALTEIVQVQAVVQANILGEIVAFYEGGETGSIGEDLDASGVIGDATDSTSGYQSEPVGTVVPIRYELEIATGAPSIAFEGDGEGAAAEFQFTVTRSGSIKTTSSLNYVIEGGVSAADVSGGILSGEIFFDVNEKEKAIDVVLDNDTLREASETLTVVISDPTETSMIVQDRASVTIKDDDPSAPEVGLTRTDYTMTEGATEFLDAVDVDYFDTAAYFKLEWVDNGGTLTTKNGSSNYDGTAFVSSYDMQTSVLRNLEFQSNSGATATSQANVIFTLTAAENLDGTGRSASTEFDIDFDVHRLPEVDISGISFQAATLFAGLPTEISGVTISDPDNDFLTVTVDTDLAGILFSDSTADYSVSENSATSVSFSGATGSVQDALDNLRFMADAAGDVRLTFSVDDNDPLHSRNADGTLASATSSAQMAADAAETIAASAPTISQTFEPFVKVGAGFWSGFSGIEVDDIDSETVTVTVTGSSGVLDMFQLTNSTHGVSVDGLYALSGNDTDGWEAFAISGSGTSQNPYTLASTADGGTLSINQTAVDALTAVGTIGEKVNFRLSDAPAGIVAPVLQYPTGSFEVSGSSDYVNSILSLIEVEVSQNMDGLVSVTVNDGDSATSNATLTPVYLPVLNAVPDPGGNVSTAAAINEDGGAQAITISGIQLFDSDALDVSGTLIPPSSVRIVSSTGGEVLTSTGAAVVDDTGASIDIALASGVLNLQFIPEADFTGDAKIKYVVVDPQQGTFISPVSEITVSVSDVNDAPSVRLSPVPTVYTQDQDPVSIFSNVSVTDIDDTLFSEVKITAVLDTDAGDLALIAPDEIFGMSKAIDGNSITYSGANITAANVSALLNNIKFQTASNNLVGETRSVEVAVKDDAGLESVSVSKDIILIDVNDAPELSGGSVSETFTEGASTGVVMSTFGSIADPEGNNISKVVIQFEGGYKLGQDIISSSDASGTVSTDFDEATGAFTLEALSSLGLTAAEFNAILANVSYKNVSNNPDDGSTREFVLELTDAAGQPGLSSVKTVTLQAQNDSPEVFAIVAGSEEASVAGAKFVSGANAVRVAPSVSIRDLDSNDFQFAEVTVRDSTTSGTAVVSLSANGEQLKTAYNLTVESIAGVSGTSGPGLKIYKGAAADSNYVDRGTLEAILREVSYENTGSSIGGNEDILEFAVTDKDGAVSTLSDSVSVDPFTAAVSLLDTPPVEVKPTTVEVGSDLETSGATGTANVLTFNADSNDASVRLFFANQLTTDLSTASIRTDGVRYKYDPSITSDRVSLNKAAHVDLRLLDGVADATVTNVMGLTTANVIYGSDFTDYIDGNGGKDIVKAGTGDDTVVLRLDTSGASFDGGDGTDTLILPGNTSGTIDLENFSAYATTVTVSGFENLDVRSATSDLTLKGNASVNELLAGSGADTIWLGAGGDIARGGGSADIFVVDVSASSTGGEILDLKNVDKIKFHDGSGYIATSDVTWLHYPSYSAAPTVTTPYSAYVTSGTSGYSLNIEDSGGTVTSIAIGTSLFGSLGKWDQTGETDFTLKPTANSATVFDLRGPLTSPNAPIELTAAGGGGFTFTLTGTGNVVSVADSDASEQIHLDVTATGVDVTVGGSAPSASGVTDSVTNINTLLETVTVTGASRGEGSVTLSMTDGFSKPITKTIYFEIPNSEPTIALDTTGATLSSEIGSGVSLDSAGAVLTIADTDGLDVSDKTLKISMDIRGGLASYQGQYGQLVTISGGKVTIAHDGITAIPTDETWIDILTEIASDIIITKGVVGSVSAAISVEDLEGGPGPVNISFAFEPKDLAKPQLLTSAEPPAEGDTLALNGSQFDAGKLRVFIKDIGANVGDEIVVTTKIGGVTQAADTKAIPPSASNPDAVVPFIDFNLKDLVSEGVKNGAYEITAALHIGGEERSTSDITDPVTFSVDTIAPDTPTIEFINLETDAVSTVSNSDITTLTVSDANTETGLAHAVVKIFGPEDGDWYQLPTDFDLNSIRLGTGQFIGEILPTSTYDTENGVYRLDLGTNPLDDGVYAVIARDSVGNVSTISTSTFNVSTGTYPAAVFVVDQSLGLEDIGYAILNAQYIDGVDYRFYKLGADQASGIELGVRPQALGATLPEDIVGLKIEVWADSANLGSETVSANVVAEFERDLTAVSNYWSKKADVEGEYIDISSAKSAELAPVVVLDLESGLSGVSGFVGIRISVQDIAGNIVFVDTPADQIELDLVADETVATEPNEGKVTSVVSEDIVSGISRVEAEGLGVELIGLDVDANARASFILSLDQMQSNMYRKSSNTLHSLNEAEIRALTMDDAAWELVNGVKVPSFNSREFYLDFNSAFLDSLTSISSGEAPSTIGSPIDWKIIGVSAEGANYIRHSDWNDYALGINTNPEVFVSSFVMNAHINGDPQTRLTSFSQDVTPILKTAGSPDEPIFIINQVFDLAGNTGFRGGILQEGDLTADVVSTLRVDVKDAIVQEGLVLSDGDDTGKFTDDLVTNETSPSLTFSTDEEIVSARLVQISHLNSSVAEGTTLGAYDLTISETDADDGFTYDANLARATSILAHGLWAVEVTDVAGNVSLPANELVDFDTNTSLVEDLDGMFVVDTQPPPDAEITIESVEVEGGFLNQYEVSAEITFEVQPGVDDMANALENYQIADVTNVTILGAADFTLDLGSTPVDEVEGLETYVFDAASLADGTYTIRVTALDIAGNTTQTDYDFTKDTASPVDPVTAITLDGVNNAAAIGDYGSDGVLNRTEIGYGEGGEDLGIDIALADAAGTRVVSVKVDAYDVWGLPYDIELGGVHTHTLAENAFGTHAAGEYVITEVSDGAFEAHLVTGSALTNDGAPVESDGIPVYTFTQAQVEALELDLGFTLVEGVAYMIEETNNTLVEVTLDQTTADVSDDYVPVEPPAVTPLNDYGGADVLKSWINVSNSIPSVGFVASSEEEPESFDDPYIVSQTGISLEGFSPTAATGFIPVGLLDRFYGDSLAELTSVNLVSVLNPDEYHEIDVDHTLSVVVADLAGNLTTQMLDFNIDTRLADAPDVIIERTISATPALDLNYWETIETFNGVQGVRIQFNETSPGDQVLGDSVSVNGVAATVVDQGTGVYFVARTDLVDSVNGLSRIGDVDFEVDGVTSARSIFSLTALAHGVSEDGNYILVGNSSDGWQAHSVSGDGDNIAYNASATPDLGSLNVASLFEGSNIVEFDVVDASGNINTYIDLFTSDLDQLSDQYFAVIPTAYTASEGTTEQDYVRLDIYVSEQAFAEALGVSQFGGTSLDLKLDLPSNIFSMGSQDVAVSSSDIFTMAEGYFDADMDVVRWSGFVDTEVSSYNLPIFSIDFKVDDFDAVKDEVGDVVLTIAKIGEEDVTSQMDVLGLSYDIQLSDLILTPYDQTV